MAERQGRGRQRGATAVVEEKDVFEVPSSDSTLSEFQIERARLRKRWELASVLNFLHVFRSVIQNDKKISSEEIEEALINPNDVLAKLHIALLKGIPPVSKNLSVPDAWVTVLCKKLDSWWPWVAEGEIPLAADRGAEIPRYKELEPTMRLLILKALCEVRAEQDDVLGYIDETLKNGVPLSTFRKEKIGGDRNGTTYWYDGDSVIGHRLYKEVVIVDSKQRLKGKRRSTKPSVEFLWETLATDPEEFQQISVKLSDSKIMEEAAVGNIVKVDIMPVIEKLQKKKERALKRQQKEALLLSGFSGHLFGSRRSCRDRGPVNYTFEEFDRSINEALRIEKKRKATEMLDTSKRGEHVEGNGSISEGNSHDTLHEIDEDDKRLDSDRDDEDYNGKSDDGVDCASGYSDKEKYMKAVVAAGLRRSTRNMSNVNHDSFSSKGMGHGEMKKRLRQRPTRNTDYSALVIPDSEDENSSEKEGED